jgi:alpha-D-xyloside xylohydrolase
MRSIALPAGGSVYDWWTPTGDAIAGGTTLTQDDSADREKYPLFVMQGAIVPLNVSTDVVAVVGSAASAGKLTVLVYPSATASTFTFYEDDDTTTQLGQSLSGSTISVTLARTLEPTLLRVRIDAAGGAAGVTANGVALTAQADFATLAASSGGWWMDTATRSVWVELPAGPSSQSVAISTAP